MAIPECFSQIDVDFIPPKAYSGISSVFLESSKSMYYFSGVAYDGSYRYGLHRFYYDEIVDSWRVAQQQVYNSPDPRSSYGSFFYNNTYYIYGGIGPNGIYNDIWSYDIVGEYWTQIASNQLVPPRYSFAYTSFTYKGVFYFAVLGGNTYNPTLEPNLDSTTEVGTGLLDLYL